MSAFRNHVSVTALMVSAGLMALAAPAHAQDAAAASQEEDAADQGGDIVVVAQGRAQQLSEVPLAISAVSAQSLQNSGASDIRQLNQIAPSLLVSSTSSEANGSARMRGIGTVGDNPGLESSVAVFIDGVYRSRSGIGLSELGEVERIEVLRGPQGTLFGRNASAGLIHVISKKPSFKFGANAEATYGNYDYLRFAAGVTGPITENIAGRLEGVYVKRDGFLKDPNNDGRVNDRDRYFLRGQLMFEPTENVSFRLIGDYTSRTEGCCAGIYVDSSVNPFIGNLNNPAAPLSSQTGNNIINVLTALGQNPALFNSGWERTASVTAGKPYEGKTTDGGVSGELNWDFGGAQLTSITAYRQYKSSQWGDTDYTAADILYRRNDGNAYRRFKTFSQELRLQGEAFDDKLDWLVGGYFANENIRVVDNLRFGAQYGRFATCRLVSGSALSALYNPAAAGCLAARPALFGAATPLVYATIDRLDGINDRGSTGDVYKQTSRNWALFTHNIFHVTDKFDVTLGLRYTNERKKLNATFGNDNTACIAQQQALGSFLVPGHPLQAIAAGVIGLSCQGNSTAELNGVSVKDQRNEDEFTGTAVLSYKPNDDLMFYASYSRGYKAGGFNLDRSALKNPVIPFARLGGAQALVGNLQFDPEKVNAFEIGGKYSTGPFSLNLALFRQDFSNFQLNTFDGTSYIVQNIGGCSTDLGGADRDQSKFPAAPNYNPAAATTGACAKDDVTYGVRSQGVEIEASLVPARNFRVGLGLTYADTKYRDNLIGDADGAPLNQALRMLPGRRMSNAPQWVATGSAAWTPQLTDSLSGLFYVDGRMTSDYNTGSDLFPQKAQDGYFVANARVGIRGPEERWAIEFWGQNIFNKNYAQVAFNSPFQEGGISTTTAFADPQYPGGRQLFSMFLAEPRTYGVTVRFKM